MDEALVLVLTGLLTAVSVMLLCRLWREHVARRDAEKFALARTVDEFDLSWASREAQKQAAIETAKRQQAGSDVQPMAEWQTTSDSLAPSGDAGKDSGSAWATNMGLTQLDTAILDHDALAGDQADVAPMPEAFLDR